jgi:hypothetical protein
MGYVTVCKKYLGWCPNAPAIRTATAVLAVPPEDIHPAQPGDGGSAGSSSRIRSGVSIAAGSLKAVFRDRQLLFFMTMTGFVMLFLIAMEVFFVAHLERLLSSIISLPLGESFIMFDTRFFILSFSFGDSSLYLDLSLFLVDMICLFCFTILLAGLVLYRAGTRAQQPVTVRGIFYNVLTHATTLAVLSVTMALFGTILDAIISQSQFFGKIISAIEMAIFNLPYAYYLQGEPIYSALLFSFEIMFINIVLFLIALYVVPVIVLENKGLVPALAGSVSLMRRTGRELLGCTVIYGAIVLGIAAVALVIGQSPLLLNHDYDFFINMSRGQPLMMAVCFLFIIACWTMMAAGFTAAGIATTDLYVYGKIGQVPGGDTGHIITTRPVKDPSSGDKGSDMQNR